MELDEQPMKTQIWGGIYMIKTGIIRKFDDLGRIVIPRLVRQEVFGTSKNEGKLMEIFYEKDGTIILKPVKEN